MNNFYTDHAYAAARNDFKAFVRFSFNLVHPEISFADNFHIDALCHQLSCIHSGEIRRLAVNLPPRTLKSFIVSVAWPAFILGHDPTKRVIVISHNEKLAADHAQLFRKLIDHPRMKQVFPTLKPEPSKNTELIYTTSKLGGRTAMWPFSGITGMGTDIIILDDLISAQDAASQKTCDGVADWIKGNVMTRFNDPATSIMVSVMQRLSIWDPHAQLVTHEWTQLILPATAPFSMKVKTGPMCHYVWEKGALLHPARLPQQVLDEMAQHLGPARFQAQFMQAPLPAGGGLIDVTLFKKYKVFPRKRPDSWLISIDPATGGPSAKSYSVILVFAVFDGRLYLYDLWRKRVMFPELKNQTAKMILFYKPRDVIIEYASSGSPLAEEVNCFLQNVRYSGSRSDTKLHPFTPKMSKEARWDEASLLVTDGRLYIPRNASWLKGFLDECRAFPEGSNDDQVDALSQAIVGYNRLYDRPRKMGG